jgi:hypothetical protein
MQYNIFWFRIKLYSHVAILLIAAVAQHVIVT